MVINVINDDEDFLQHHSWLTDMTATYLCLPH